MGSRPSWDGQERRKSENADWRKCYDDLRVRGRSLRAWTVGLALWLTAISLIGFLSVKSALDQIQQQRRTSIIAQCRNHDAFVRAYTDRVNDTLHDPAKLAAEAIERHETIEQERKRLEDGKAFTITLIENLAPRNPRSPNDDRPCDVIAQAVAG